MPFAMYGTAAAAKNTAPVKTSHGSQCPQGLQTCAEAQLAAKTAATRVHHMFPAMEPAVAPQRESSEYRTFCRTFAKPQIEIEPHGEDQAVDQHAPSQENIFSTFQGPNLFIFVVILECNGGGGRNEYHGGCDQSAGVQCGGDFEKTS